MKTTDQDRIDMVNRYNSGEKISNIARSYGVTPANVYAILKRRNVNIRGLSQAHRKYTLNELFFDTLNHTSSYVLGFLYADGYHNEKSHSISLGLAKKDRQILDDITRILQPDKPLQHIKYENKKYDDRKRSDQYRMVVCSTKLSGRLVELGCRQNKTYTLTFPDFLDDVCMPHFVRGYFDGDGSVSNTIRHGNESASIIGNKSFISDLQDHLVRSSVLNKTKRYYRFKENSAICSIVICGINQLNNLYNYMYTNDADLYLKRKKEKFEEIFVKHLDQKERNG